MEQRRANHNATERARRENLNGKFLQLASVNPLLREQRKPSKAAIVNKSLDYILICHHRLSSLESLAQDMLNEYRGMISEVNATRANQGLAPRSDRSAEFMARLEAMSEERVSPSDSNLLGSPGSLTSETQIPLTPRTPTPISTGSGKIQNHMPRIDISMPQSMTPTSAVPLSAISAYSYGSVNTPIQPHFSQQVYSSTCPTVNMQLQQQLQHTLILNDMIAPPQQQQQPYRQSGFNALRDSSVYATLSPAAKPTITDDEMTDALTELTEFLME